MARGKLGDERPRRCRGDLPPGAQGQGGNLHFGSRLAFAPDGTLFVTLGERFQFDPAQDLTSDLGKIVRINPDGSMPEGQSLRRPKDARPEIWSYGHRNPQGAAIDPETGKLWETEFGPRGGDELNIPKAGCELRLAGGELGHAL